ncbi:hypothetical protein A0J61_04853 [Choanephora cucurbitarum]|uniref:Uncharacterized protein n=1 Tax=Choanephora cucurbitarum TaxID=101091 RepID=A0A1C7NEX3_9FUNG|nr:hypothetical protein A0J61_04853 [Choanephora cucurbitarum]
MYLNRAIRSAATSPYVAIHCLLTVSFQLSSRCFLVFQNELSTELCTTEECHTPSLIPELCYRFFMDNQEKRQVE